MGLYPKKQKSSVDLQGGFSVGGTAVTATAAELNKTDGLTADTAELNRIDDANAAAAGLGFLRVAKAQYSFATHGGAQGAIALGVTLPDKAVVCGGFVDVVTPPTSGGAGTLAIHVQAANDIVTAAAVGGVPWSTAGLKAITPKANTPESTGIKLTAAREVTATIGTADLTAGVVNVFLYYVVSN